MSAAAPAYVDSRWICARLGISTTTLWRWQKAGTFLAPRYTPGGQRRWLAADLEAWEGEHLRAQEPHAANT
jgi:predicted DNA-binding transcriptional regulator AlpA